MPPLQQLLTPVMRPIEDEPTETPVHIASTEPAGPCENRALVYRDSPRSFGGRELERIIPCGEPAATSRWSRRGTDQARQQRYCQAHADDLDAFRRHLNERVDAAYAARGEQPLGHHVGDRVCTPGGPGTVVGLPSAAWSDTFAVGLDTRRRGDRPSEFHPHQLAASTRG